MSIPETSDTQTDIVQTEPTTPSMEEQLATSKARELETQQSYTKGQQSISSLKAENAKLLEQLEATSTVSISAEDQETLDALKYEDPEAWRSKLNSLESKAKTETTAKLAELTSEAKGAAEAQFELSRRTQVLKEFNDSASVAITDELIANDVPPRISNKLAKGTITFEEFLTEVQTYVTAGKVVANDKTLAQPNMGHMGGGVTPQDMKPEKSLSKNYSGDMY